MSNVKKTAAFLIAAILLLTLLPFPVMAEGDSGNTLSDPVNGPEETIHIDNGIPVIYLNIDEEQGSIQDMMNDVDHSVFCYGTLSIEVPEGFHYSDLADRLCESVEGLSMSIRGRGNSTWRWGSAKKPFKIKLDKKADLFGLGKNKHWVLVANAFDSTLVRDRLTGWLGDRMGFEFTPRGVPVDLVMTGENFGSKYLGSYYFSENVRVDTNRLEIDELKESDTEEPEITGGYLLQNGVQEPQDSADVFITENGENWATHTPSFNTGGSEAVNGASGEETYSDSDLEDGYVNPVQQTYIQKYIQKVEDALFADGFEGEDGISYRSLMDLESAARYWLVNEVSLNGDGYSTGSTYIYKKRDGNGTTGKLYWGPLWDFDFAWNNTDETEGFKLHGIWERALLYDREADGFVQKVKEYWPEMREYLLELTAEGGVLDQYYEETKSSAEADFQLYYEEYSRERGTEFDYKAEIENLRNWIQLRIAWVDENLSILDNLIHKVKYVADGKVWQTRFIKDGETLSLSEIYPEKEGYIFLGWVDENGEYTTPEIPIDRDRTFTATYIAEGDATHGRKIAFQQSCGAARYYNAFAHAYQIYYSVLPTDAQDQKVEWTSSDESIATVNEEGFVDFVDPGDEPKTVTLTAKLPYGESRDFALTIFNGDMPVPEAITADKEEVRLAPGDQDSITVIPVPSPAQLDRFEYWTDDTDIVKVDGRGVLTAVGKGETQVHVRTVTYADEEILLEKAVKVIVSEKQPQPQPEPQPQPVPEQKSLKGAVITGLGAVTYTGSAVRPEVSVKLDNKTLVKGTDYTVSYSNNTNAGKATVTITGKGNYKDSVSGNFTIRPVSLASNASLSYKKITYTGKALQPGVKAAAGGKTRTLKKGKDYTVTYKNNKYVGTATAKIQGKGNYSGTVTLKFSITKAKNPLKINVSKKTYKQTSLKKSKKTFNIVVTKAKGKKTFSLNAKAKAAKIKVNKKGEVTIPKNCKRGTYKITVRAAGTNNYKVGKQTVTIRVQ